MTRTRRLGKAYHGCAGLDLFTPILPNRDIATRNWIEPSLSGYIRAVMDVHIPTVSWDRRHVMDGSRYAGIPRSVCYHLL